MVIGICYEDETAQTMNCVIMQMRDTLYVGILDTMTRCLMSMYDVTCTHVCNVYVYVNNVYV